MSEDKRKVIFEEFVNGEDYLSGEFKITFPYRYNSNSKYRLISENVSIGQIINSLTDEQLVKLKKRFNKELTKHYLRLLNE